MVSETYHKQERESYHYTYSSVGYSVSSNGVVTGSKDPSTSRGTQYPFLNSFDGIRNPLWRAQISSGNNATTPAFGSKSSRTVKPFLATCSFKIWDPNSPYDVSTHFYSIYGYIPYGAASAIVPAPSEVSASVRNRVISKFISKCKDARSSIDGGQNLYELRETLNSIRHPFKSLTKATTLYASKVFKLKTSRSYKGAAGLRGLSNAITDTYLEYNFGISPTVSDIAKLIANAGRTRFDVIPISASASMEFSGTVGRYDPPLPSFMTYFMNRTEKSKLTMRYKGAIRTGVDAQGHISMAQSLRLTPSDFLPTIWNILPYSWMLDYVANIGDIIEALSFTESNVSWGCITTRNENTVTYEGNGFPSTSGLIHNANHEFALSEFDAYGGNAVFKTVSFTRDKLTGSDLVPTFQLKVPTSVKPYLNTFAVAIQHLWGLSSK